VYYSGPFNSWAVKWTLYLSAVLLPISVLYAEIVRIGGVREAAASWTADAEIEHVASFEVLRDAGLCLLRGGALIEFLGVQRLDAAFVVMMDPAFLMGCASCKSSFKFPGQDLCWLAPAA